MPRGDADSGGRRGFHGHTLPLPFKRSPPSKRALDMGLSAIGLLISAPIGLAIALLVKMEDGDSVFYVQKRVGLGGKPFKSLKFRSMSPLGIGHEPPSSAELEADRVTRIGRIMRATALDELPQLWSIFIGDMSFVGPRALVPIEVVERDGVRTLSTLADVPGYEERQSVAPGLTGLAQLYLARDAPNRAKFRLDLLYVRRRTLWLDVKLIAASVLVSLRGRWPSVGGGRP
ncbi:MAG: sugar transferase [Longimicrobiales bacterium]